MKQYDLKDPYQRLFYDETLEHIKTFENLIIDEVTGALNDLFRLAHSIKGSSATMEIDDLVVLSHALEESLDYFKRSKIAPTSHWTKVALSAIDQMRLILDKTFGLPSLGGLEKTENLIEAIQNASRSSDQVPKKVLKYHVSVHFEDEVIFLGIKALMIQRSLEKMGTILTTRPSDLNSPDSDFNGRFELDFETTQDSTVIKKQIMTVSEISSVTIKEKQEKPGGKPKSKDLVKDTIRINLSKIKDINTWAEALIMDKFILGNIISELQSEGYRGTQLSRLIMLQDHMERTSDALQMHLNEIKLVPIKVLFDTLPRTIKELAESSGVSINYSISGGDIGIDRNILEQLLDPMTHIIRNSFSHGFKNRKSGNIKVSANQVSDLVIIEIADDGNGIDCDIIKEKALNRGWISQEEAETYLEQDWFEFIFKPGFTTTETVTQISGRGVGLDVVKENLNRINGVIEVQSQVGNGTLFTLKMPVTQSVYKAVIIKCCGYQFAIPMVSVLELIEPDNREVKTVEWHNQRLSVLNLGAYFNSESARGGFKSILVINIAEKHFALGIDALVREEEIVIQSMMHLYKEPQLLKTQPYISGLTVLSDSTIAYIMDLNLILRTKEMRNESTDC